ncbi:MAG: tRNA (adenosine(37)-N6)-threonylcarbamoyltransferase complex ATPase subunit type 1 TsaE [Acidobacteria bacterium]|nr:MAG: tRNA (adenosine(37)-N6)-threonylcarbamoyltransferase complex ATPase subunit type 1 TsaE [Acidobacteriota bacterium]
MSASTCRKPSVPLIPKVSCRNERPPMIVPAEKASGISEGEWLSVSSHETFRLGQKIGAQVRGGEILLMSGALGAGKTLFVKGIASALGLDPEEVTSPSFTLVNPHEGGRLFLYHIDLYRLEEGATAAHAVDLEELLAHEHSVIVIEWADRLREYKLPAGTWKITISGVGEEPRTVAISRLKI